MKGRLRRAWIRWARRIGRRERVKLAEVKRADAERGGRPCLLHWRLADGSVRIRRVIKSTKVPDEVC